ncbi:hypothetical protein GF345_00980, partial [Candidatus Woesearchaeota archaeon]|nr:hypothetical protein [Candidatus Woesearchaeota archaeon]
MEFISKKRIWMISMAVLCLIILCLPSALAWPRMNSLVIYTPFWGGSTYDVGSEIFVKTESHVKHGRSHKYYYRIWCQYSIDGSPYTTYYYTGWRSGPWEDNTHYEECRLNTGMQDIINKTLASPDPSRASLTIKALGERDNGDHKWFSDTISMYLTCDRDGDGDRLPICGGNDCNDRDAEINSFLTEEEFYTADGDECDRKDNDCDGVADDGLDCDHDGYSSQFVNSIDNPNDPTTTIPDDEVDCDNYDSEVHPYPEGFEGPQEKCDGKDNNCDGLIDNGDWDIDGYVVCDDCDDNLTDDPIIKDEFDNVVPCPVPGEACTEVFAGCAYCINPNAADYEGDDFDSNCDGVDKSCSLVANQVNRIYEGGSPRLFWTGDSYVLFYMKEGSLIFYKNGATKDLDVGGQEIIFYNDEKDEFMLSYLDSSYNVVAMRLNESGNVLSQGIAASLNQYDSYNIIYNDMEEEYAIVYDIQDDIYFAKLDSSGNKIGGTERLLIEGSNSIFVKDIIWNTDREVYAIGLVEWKHTTAYKNIYLLDKDGIMLKTTTIELSKVTGSIRIRWNGNDYGIFTENKFMQLDKDGSLIPESEKPVTLGDIEWTGDHYVNTFNRFVDTNPEVFFSRLDREGNPIGSEIMVSQNLEFNSSRSPSLAFNGITSGLAFVSEVKTQQYQGGPVDTKFYVEMTEIECCDDFDFDGYLPCGAEKDCDNHDPDSYPGAVE